MRKLKKKGSQLIFMILSKWRWKTKKTMAIQKNKLTRLLEHHLLQTLTI